MDATPPIMRYHTPPAHYEDTNPLEYHDPPTFETPKSTRSSHWRELLDDTAIPHSHHTHPDDASYHEKIYDEIHELKRQMQHIEQSIKESTLYVLELHVMLEDALRLRAP